MSDLEHQLREDRALRDAARALIDADVEILKTGADPKAAATNLLDKTRVNARNMADTTAQFTGRNKLGIGGAIAALALAGLAWVFRDQIRKLIKHIRN